jgi:hypothetical protein
MGYRSDVKYVILFKTEEQRQAFKLEAMLVAADIESGLDVINNDWEYKIDLHDVDFPYQIRVHYEDVKWYESTPWVDLQERLMKLARDSYEGGFVFLRLGEEDDDVEAQSGVHDDDIHVYVDNYIELTRRSRFI